MKNNGSQNPIYDNVTRDLGFSIETMGFPPLREPYTPAVNRLATTRENPLVAAMTRVNVE